MSKAKPADTVYPCLRVMKLADILPTIKNPRKISDIGLQRLERSLTKLGNLQPVTFNVRTNRLIGGNQRLKLYSAKKVDELPVWCVDLDENKEKLAIIALNNTYGNWDEVILREIVQDIQTKNGDIEITGFDDHWADKLKEKFAIPSEDEALSELRFEDKPVYPNVGWMVIRCPEDHIPKIRAAIFPIIDALGAKIQIETNV